MGSQDVVPPGFRAPGMPGGDGFPGGVPGGIPGMGGGMHMGPRDPMFLGGPRPGFRPGEGLHPGEARWDPIRPPGMEVGFSLLKPCVFCPRICVIIRGPNCEV